MKHWGSKKSPLFTWQKSITRVMYFKKKQYFIVLFILRVIPWGKYCANTVSRCQTRLDHVWPTWDRNWVKGPMCPQKCCLKHINHIHPCCIIVLTKHEETYQGWLLRIRNLLDEKKYFLLEQEKERFLSDRWLFIPIAETFSLICQVYI